MTLAGERIVAVGLGEIHTANTGETVLISLGLGSCVGVALYDPRALVGGMAHVVLPEPLDERAVPSPKFATIAVPQLVARLKRLGANRRRLVCTIAGGAQVLSTGPARHDFGIGKRNIEAVLAALTAEGIVPRAQDCGGTAGRSFRLQLQEGRMAVKRPGENWRDL